MLTRLIVASYAWLLEIALWFALALSAVVGYQRIVPVMNQAGAIVTPEFVWSILGALVAAVIGFLVLSVIAGPLLILVDIRREVRDIKARLDRGIDARGGSRPVERIEPTI